jgi:DNA modification methylase
MMTMLPAQETENSTKHIRDIFPRSPVAELQRDWSAAELSTQFDREHVSAAVGMAESFIRRALGKPVERITLKDVLFLLNLDVYAETFVPRSMVPQYLFSTLGRSEPVPLQLTDAHILIQGCAKDLIPRIPTGSVRCVVTSTPYWGTRLYEEPSPVKWADGESCVFGNEQTPEGFIRHTAELLYLLKDSITSNGSVWWNLMDTYNTRTQIRQNAAETLRAMQGKDERGWLDYDCRRYSAGHSYLKDGEQCGIPAKVAARASRLGYYVKSMISWKKEQSMPETVSTRVTRQVEYVIHLSKERSPLFHKEEYTRLPAALGGRNEAFESGKVTDVWVFSSSPGRDGHGAQFPMALPARCIALSTDEGDYVLDPFVGSGTTLVAAALLQRKAIGFDLSASYLATAKDRLNAALTIQSLGREKHHPQDSLPLFPSP